MEILLCGKLYNIDNDINIYSEVCVEDMYAKEYIKLYMRNYSENMKIYSESSKLLKSMSTLLSNIKTRTSDKLRSIGNAISNITKSKPEVSYYSYQIGSSENHLSLGTILSKEFNEKQIRKEDIIKYAKGTYSEVKARLNLSKEFSTFVAANKSKYKGKINEDTKWNIAIDEVSKVMSLFQDYTYSESFFIDNKELSSLVFEVINDRLKDDFSFVKDKYSELLPKHPLKGLRGGEELLSDVEAKLRKSIPTLPKINTLVTHVCDVLENYANILAASWFLTLSAHVWLTTKDWYYKNAKEKAKINGAVSSNFISDNDIREIIKKLDPSDKLKEVVELINLKRMKSSIVNLTNTAVKVMGEGKDYKFDKFISQVFKECDKMLTLKYKPNNLIEYLNIDKATNEIEYVDIDNKENKIEIIKTQDKFFIIANKDTYKTTLRVQYELINHLRKSKVDLDMSANEIIKFSSGLSKIGGYIGDNIKSFESVVGDDSESKIVKDLVNVSFSLYVNLWSCLDIMLFLLNNIGHPMYRKIKLDIASLVLGSYVYMLEDLD